MKRVKVETGIFRNLDAAGVERSWSVSVPDPTRPGRSILRTVPAPGGKRRAREFRAHLVAGARPDRARGDRGATLSQALDSYVLSKRTTCSESTVEDYERAARLHIKPTIGALLISQITADDLLGWIGVQRAGGSSAWSLRSRWNVLRGALALAQRRGEIQVSPCDALQRGERPPPGGTSMRILHRDEIDAVLQAAPDAYSRTFCVVAIFTGLRFGELLGLRWEDVDTKAGVISVTSQINSKGKRTPPKTPEAVREVVLGRSLADVLRQHRISSPHSHAHHPVFASRVGTPLDRGAARARWTKSLAAAGVTGARLHDARHTFASILISGQGEDIKFVSAQLGHANAATTLKVYTKLFDRQKHMDRVRDGLDDEFGGMIAGG